VGKKIAAKGLLSGRTHKLSSQLSTRRTRLRPARWVTGRFPSHCGGNELSPATISPCIKELAGKTKLANKRFRQPGGGRRKIVAQLPAVEEVVNLIGATTSTSGFAVECQLDPTEYKQGRTVSASEFEQIRHVQV